MAERKRTKTRKQPIESTQQEFIGYLPLNTGEATLLLELLTNLLMEKQTIVHHSKQECWDALLERIRRMASADLTGDGNEAEAKEGADRKARVRQARGKFAH